MPKYAEDASLALEPHGPVRPFKPLDDMVWIKLDEPKKMVGSIELVVPEKTHWGTVVATGDGHRVGGVDRMHPKDPTHCKECARRGMVIPMLVKAGDRVNVIRGIGHQLDDTGLMIEVSEGQILGRMEE